MEISQITSLVMRQGLNEERSAQDLADRLVEYARVCMFKKDKVSPFQSWSSPINLINIDHQSSFSVSAAREGIFFRGGVSSLFFSLYFN